jgi:hypothetical protein
MYKPQLRAVLPAKAHGVALKLWELIKHYQMLI